MERGREFEVRLVDEMLMRSEECRAQDGVIPVKNDASLTDLRFVLRT